MRSPLAACVVAAAALFAAGCGGDGAVDRHAQAAAPTPTPDHDDRDAQARPAQRQADASAREPWAQLQALAGVATRNRATRAAATPGGVATEELIAQRLRAAGWAVRFERVGFPFFDERRRPAVVLPGGRRLGAREVRTLAYSAGGAANAPVRVVGGDRPNAGCAAGDWRGFPRGQIAFARRGVCPFGAKARRAQAAGAAALIVEDRAATDGRPPVSGTLGAPGIRIPVVAVNAQSGAAVRAAAGAVRLRVDAVSERRAARNVIAELAGTDGSRVVMAGAHLDSVAEGPGVNDDGSGVAGLLAIAARLSAGPRPRDTVRLGFWTAEELGLYGSRRHVAVMPATERRRLRSYVNLDMIASPNGVLETYGAGATEAALRRALDAHGPTPARTSLGGSSDHAAFARAGIEVGGVFTGASERVGADEARRFGARAGRPADPCYHQSCDTLANADRASLERITDAVEAALRSLAG